MKVHYSTRTDGPTNPWFAAQGLTVYSLDTKVAECGARTRHGGVNVTADWDAVTCDKCLAAR